MNISKKAVERHIERIGPAPGPREGYHPSLNYDTIAMLRALSARVEELTKEVATLSDELDMREQEGCDFDTELIRAEQQAFRNGRLQGLEEAEKWLQEYCFAHDREDLAEKMVEALKGEQK